MKINITQFEASQIYPWEDFEVGDYAIHRRWTIPENDDITAMPMLVGEFEKVTEIYQDEITLANGKKYEAFELVRASRIGSWNKGE